MKKELQELIAFNKFNSNEKFDNWILKLQSSDNFTKWFFSYPKLWYKLMLKVAKCLDVGSSSFLLENVCIVLLKFVGGNFYAHESLVYVIDNSNNSTIQYIVEKLCSSALKQPLQAQICKPLCKLLNILLFRKTKLMQSSRNSNFSQFVKKIESCDNELILKEDILYPLISSILSLKASNIRSNFSSSSKWKNKLERINKKESWINISNVQIRLSMAFVVYKSPQYIYFINKDEVNVLYDLCFNVLTSEINTSFQESNKFITNNEIDKNGNKNNIHDENNYNNITMIQRFQAYAIISLALQRPNQSSYINNATLSFCKFTRETIDMVKDRFDAATKFVDKEDKYNSLLSVQPALDLIHDAITNATIDLKDKILEVMNTNNFTDILWQVLGYVTIELNEYGISLCISILNTLKLLNSNIPNQKSAYNDRDFLNIILIFATNEKILELSIPAIDFLKLKGTTSQVVSCIDHLRSSMLKGIDKLIIVKNKIQIKKAGATVSTSNNNNNNNDSNFQLIDLKIRQLACILLSEDWQDSKNVQEYMKLFSTDGRVIKILRQALLSANKATVRLGMDIIYIFLTAGKTDMTELSYFADSWGTSNRDINDERVNVNAEDFEKMKVLEEMLENKNEEFKELQDQMKKERDHFERQTFEQKVSHEDTIRDLKKELRKANEKLTSETSRFEEHLKHKDSVINLKELSFERIVEQTDNLRNERDIAEREAGLLRRKLRALENRIDEVAKQLLESYESGAEEVAKRDKKIQQMKHSHNFEIESFKKQNSSSINKLKKEMEDNISKLMESNNIKDVDIEHLKEEIELNKLDLMKKDKEHDNVVRQLVKRLNKMIIAYEKK